jgi:hypothetical protein
MRKRIRLEPVPKASTATTINEQLSRSDPASSKLKGVRFFVRSERLRFKTKGVPPFPTCSLQSKLNDKYISLPSRWS